MLIHRPFGTEHPYRHDLDQRVPARPHSGQDYEIRVLTDPAVSAVTVVFDDGRTVAAHRVEPASVVVDFGPPPAPPAGSAGHLAAAATATPDTGGRTVWIAYCRDEADTAYHIVAATAQGDVTTTSFAVNPTTWRPTGGRLALLTGTDTDTDTGADTEAEAEADVLIPESVRWLCDSTGPRRVRFSLRLRPTDHVVGFGERFHALDQRGQILDATLFEQYKSQGHRTYLPTPYAIVTGPDGDWGFHLRTSRRSWYDVGASAADRLTVEAEMDPAEPVLQVSIYRGDAASVVSSFVAETGAPTPVPDWVFRPWISGNEWNTQERVLAQVHRSLAEGIPVGAVVIEAWSDEATFVSFRDATYPLHPDGAPHRLADFEFAADGAWPDPKAMVDQLHSLGVKVLLWQIPLIPTDRGIGEQVQADALALVEQGLAVREADGSPYHNRGWWFPGALMPDFTNPRAVAWWTAKRRYLVDEIGVDGFKTDGGEHAWGHDLRYFDGSRGDQTNNRYPVLYAAAYRQLTDVTFSRAGFTGAGAYPCHWAGDEDSTWEAFRASITAGLTAGISGVSLWGWDFGGFSGEIPSAELYLRAAAMACFCPIMQYHSEFNHHQQPSRDRTPWNIAERTGEPAVIDVFRRFAVAREALVEYLVEQARRSATSGRPLMRPLFFDHGHDERIWARPLQYQLGDDLLVAPVTEPGANTWPVWLPAGRWVDVFSGQRHSGPVELHRSVPLDEIPVYRRADAQSPALADLESYLRSSRTGS